MGFRPLSAPPAPQGAYCLLRAREQELRMREEAEAEAAGEGGVRAPSPLAQQLQEQCEQLRAALENVKAQSAASLDRVQREAAAAAQAQAQDFGHAMQASEGKLAHAHAGLRELNATVARFAAREEALVARLASAESDRAGLLHEREELQHQLHSLRERFGEVLPCASLPARRPRVRLPPRAVGAQGGRAGGECVGWGGAIRAQAKGARRLASTLTAKSRPDGRAARATTRSPSRRVCNREERAQVRARMQELQVQVAQLEQERDLARDGLRALQAEHEALTRRVAVSLFARPQPVYTMSRFTR
jgi:chromosome segregation ATPase